MSQLHKRKTGRNSQKCKLLSTATHSCQQNKMPPPKACLRSVTMFASAAMPDLSSKGNPLRCSTKIQRGKSLAISDAGSVSKAARVASRPRSPRAWSRTQADPGEFWGAVLGGEGF